MEAEEEKNKCPICGGDAEQCQDPKNQRAFEAVFKRCYVGRAINAGMRARGDDPDAQSLVAFAKFDEAKQKK